MSDFDLNEIKRLPLCVFNNQGQDCCLAFQNQSITDQSSTPINSSVFEGCGFTVTQYIADINPPYLVEFTHMNLNSRVLTLRFNETINSRSVDPTQITLQSFYRNAQFSHTLTGGVVVSNDSTIVEILLTDQDLFEIQRQRGLCSDINNCWISLTNTTALDMSDNTNVPVPNNDAKDALQFTDDTTNPVLMAFDLNLDNDTLTLSFSEIVASSSLDPTAVTILNARSENATAVQLTGGSTNSADGRVIIVNMQPVDTNKSEHPMKLVPQETTLSFLSRIV